MAVFLLVGGAYTAYVFTKAPTNESVADSQAELIVSEQTFLELYIPHLEVAVAAAEIMLKKGTRLRPLHDIAAKIAVENVAESDYLKEQYSALYAVSYSATGVYVSPIRTLNDLAATELERSFLEDMILHQELAIALAQKGLDMSLSKEVAEAVQKSIKKSEVDILSLREVWQLLPQE
jgi:uncharacterized protein (DUF305 family)